jgi:hypothetical protein
VTIFVNADGVQNPSLDVDNPLNAYFWYESADCTGQALIAEDPPQTFLPHLRKYGSMGALPNGLPDFHHPNSVQFGLGSSCLPASTVGIGSQTTILSAPASIVDASELDALLRPFHIELP